MKRAIENVALNAVKYGDPVRRVTITARKAGKEVAISIHNEGPPLSARELETIFEPFKRVSTAENSSKTGWGIGLSLVKGVCAAHGGKVTVQSQEKTGTIFTLVIPIDARAQVARAA